jgi:hypothetical protein
MNTDQILNLLEHNNNVVEVFIAGATFSGTVLAIFFTLLALPIQNILGKYSLELVKRVSFDKVYWGCFSFLGLCLLYNLTLITFGSTPVLTLLSYGLTISSVLVLALLVIHTFYLIDLRNPLRDLSNDVSKKIGSMIKNSEKTKEKQYEKMNKELEKYE